MQITELRSNALFARELFPADHPSKSRQKRSNSVPQTRLRRTHHFRDSRPYNHAPIQRQLFPKNSEQINSTKSKPKTKLKQPQQDRPRITC